MSRCRCYTHVLVAYQARGRQWCVIVVFYLLTYLYVTPAYAHVLLLECLQRERRGLEDGMCDSRKKKGRSSLTRERSLCTIVGHAYLALVFYLPILFPHHAQPYYVNAEETHWQTGEIGMGLACLANNCPLPSSSLSRSLTVGMG